MNLNPVNEVAHNSTLLGINEIRLKHKESKLKTILEEKTYFHPGN